MRRISSILAVVLTIGSITGQLPVLGIGQAAAQDVTVRSLVNETTIGDQEAVAFTIEIKGAELDELRTPQPPSAENLALMQRTPSTQRNMTIINGKLEQSVAFQWSYRPLSKGNARIGAAEVHVGGETYTTRPIGITVVDQSQRPRRPSPGRQQWPFVVPQQRQADNEPDVSPRDLFIRAVATKTTARQNEQITVEYQLYFRDGIQLRHSRLAGSWDAEGFWREEFNVDTRPVPRSVVENGLLYHMIVLKRVAVFPTRPGSLTIEPLEIETEAYLPSGSGDPFERFFSFRDQFDTVELSSEPVHIEVEPLPSGAPASFEGAVGDYEMSAALSATDIEVGEPVEARITLRGTGNVATLDAPAFDPAGIFELYDPDVQTDVNRDGDLIRGSKTFTYVLVPRSNGDFTMPPVRFTYYSPANAEYVTLEADLPEVSVTGTASPLAAGTTAEGLPVDDIAGILTTATDWVEIGERPLHKQAWPYGILLLPLGFLAGLYAYNRRAERLATDTKYARNRMAHPLAKKHLKKADALLKEKEPRAFYEEIERAVTGFVGNRLNVAEFGLTRDQLDDRLAAAGMSAADRTMLRELLEECDRARFGPVLPGRTAMESAQERAARLIVALDEAVQRNVKAAA